MSNTKSIEVSNTENTIKDFAKELFFVQGNLHATCQEIADYAGVQRTLVNYYFRSKENLLHVVYHEIIDSMKLRLNEVYINKLPFTQKVEALIDNVYSFRIQYPFLEIFNTNEAGNKMLKKSSIMNPIPSCSLSSFVEEIKEAMQKGIIRKSNPYNFLLNIMSLVSYPLTLKPLYAEVYGLSDNEYDTIIGERKQLILDILFQK